MDRGHQLGPLSVADHFVPTISARFLTQIDAGDEKRAGTVTYWPRARLSSSYTQSSSKLTFCHTCANFGKLTVLIDNKKLNF